MGNCCGTSISQSVVENANGNDTPVTLQDFTILKHVGEGGSGSVKMAKKNDSGEVFALKVISKRESLKRIASERDALSKLQSPFIPGLRYAFQTESDFYLVTRYCKGGDLRYHIHAGVFSESRTAFYTAELVCCLESIHHAGYIYRDLKPENVVLDEDGHIQLIDFGLVKWSCGATPDYVAPEILMHAKYDDSVDLWALGILVYEMLTGQTPFHDTNIARMYEKVLSLPLTQPSSMSVVISFVINSDIFLK